MENTVRSRRGRLRGAVLPAVLVLLAAVFGLMVEDASAGGDWPGWDEGWAIVAFPLGIPLVLYAERAVRRDARALRTAVSATLVVWVWGALIFAAWHLFGT